MCNCRQPLSQVISQVPLPPHLHAAETLGLLGQTLGWIIGIAWTDWIIAIFGTDEFPTGPSALTHAASALLLTLLGVSLCSVGHSGASWMV